MTQCVFVRMCRDAGIAGCSRGEQHEHGVVAAGRILIAEVVSAKALHLDIEVVPAVLLRADENLDHIGEFGGGLFCFCRYIAVGGADDSLYLGGLISVNEIVFNKLICRRDCDSTDLVKGNHAEPELVVALENKHYGVAALDAERLEVVCGLGGVLLYIAECESTLGLVVAHPHHRQLVGRFFRDSIDAVKCKIEFIVVLEADTAKYTIFIIGGLNEIISNASGGLFCLGSLCGDEGCLGIFLADLTVLRIEDNSVEFAAALADSDHAVRDKAVVEDRIAFVQDINVIAYLNLERALDDDVELLTVVRVELDGSVLLLCKVGEFYEEGLSELISEFGGEIVVDKAVLLDDFHAFAFSRDGEGGESGARAFDNINDLNTASLGALVNECEAEIRFSALQNPVILHRYTGEFRKLFGGVAFCLAQVFDSACYFFQIEVH